MIGREPKWVRTYDITQEEVIAKYKVGLVQLGRNTGLRYLTSKGVKKFVESQISEQYKRRIEINEEKVV